MNKLGSVSVFAVLLLLGCSTQTAPVPPGDAIASEQATFRVELVADGLEYPLGHGVPA